MCVHACARVCIRVCVCVRVCDHTYTLSKVCTDFVSSLCSKVTCIIQIMSFVDGELLRSWNTQACSVYREFPTSCNTKQKA